MKDVGRKNCGEDDDATLSGGSCLPFLDAKEMHREDARRREVAMVPIGLVGSITVILFFLSSTYVRKSEQSADPYNHTLSQHHTYELQTVLEKHDCAGRKIQEQLTDRQHKDLTYAPYAAVCHTFSFGPLKYHTLSNSFLTLFWRF